MKTIKNHNKLLSIILVLSLTAGTSACVNQENAASDTTDQTMIKTSATPVTTTSKSETTVTTTEVSVTETISEPEETTEMESAPMSTQASTSETSQTSSVTSDSSSPSEVEMIALPDVTGMYYMDALDEMYAFFEEHGIDGVCHYCWADHTRDEMTFRVFDQQPAGGTMIDPTQKVEVLLGVYEGFEPPTSQT